MKIFSKSTLKFFACLCLFTFNAYANFVNYGPEAAKCYVNSEDLRLISGQLFLWHGNELIPLQSVSYDAEGRVVVLPQALILVCEDCGRFYILGFQHECNGVMK